MLLCSTAAMISAVILLLSFQYEILSRQAVSHIRQDAYILAKILEIQEDPENFLNEMNYSLEDSRITYIDSLGIILFDSHENPEHMDNHIERPEINLALMQGSAEIKRYSDTLKKETYYFATVLNNNHIIRVSQSVDSVAGVFISYAPMVGILFGIGFFLCFIVSKKLAGNITEPINRINLSGNNEKTYEELLPFEKKIKEQNKQIMEQISELERRTQTIDTIIYNMKEGFILLNRYNNILSINPSGIELLQANAASYTDKNIIELIRISPVIRAVKEANEGHSQNIQFENGNKVIDAFINPVFDENNTVGGIMILLMDITEKFTAESLRREFSANVSHELKTPLTTILGFSEMIHAGMVKEEDIITFTGKIKNEVQHLIQMIDDIMKLSKLDEHPEDKHFELFPLFPVMKQVALSYSDSAMENNIKIDVLGGDFDFYANKSMIHEMLKNLVENAVKYNKPGGKILIEAAKKPEFVEITVQDTGIGIPEKHLPRIFERFYRVDSSRQRKTGGTGLGLSIVKHITLYHHGSISVKSKVDQGTTVTVLLAQNLPEK